MQNWLSSSTITNKVRVKWWWFNIKKLQRLRWETESHTRTSVSNRFPLSLIGRSFTAVLDKYSHTWSDKLTGKIVSTQCPFPKQKCKWTLFVYKPLPVFLSLGPACVSIYVDTHVGFVDRPVLRSELEKWQHKLSWNVSSDGLLPVWLCRTVASGILIPSVTVGLTQFVRSGPY